VSRLFGVDLGDEELLSPHVTQVLWSPGSLSIPGLCVPLNNEGRPAHQIGSPRKSMEALDSDGVSGWRVYSVARQDHLLARIDRGPGQKPVYNVLRFVIEGSQSAYAYDPLAGWRLAGEIYQGRAGGIEREIAEAGCAGR
jgi:hypothetical protein